MREKSCSTLLHATGYAPGPAGGTTPNASLKDCACAAPQRVSNATSATRMRYTNVMRRASRLVWRACTARVDARAYLVVPGAPPDEDRHLQRERCERTPAAARRVAWRNGARCR